MRYLPAMVVSLSLAAAMPLWADSPHPAVVRIVAKDDQGASLGSGTLVATHDQFGLVVTNWHVIRDAQQVLVRFPDGFQSQARVLKSDKDWDLAALMIWRPDTAPVKLASAAPRHGEPLTIAGYGSGTYRSARGRCTQYVSPASHLPFEMVELSAEARQGDSGGPIFNQDGQLAGVLFGAANGSTSGSYCGRVADFLASLLPPTSPPSSAPGESPATALARNQSLPPSPIASRPIAPRPIAPQPIASQPIVPQPVHEQPPLLADWPTPPAPTGPAPGPSSTLSSLPENDPLPDRVVATTPSPYSTSRPSPETSSPTPSPVRELVTSTPQPQRRAKPVEAPQNGWHDLVGQSPFEQLKSFFAGIGLLTVFSLLLRQRKAS